MAHQSYTEIENASQIHLYPLYSRAQIHHNKTLKYTHPRYFLNFTVTYHSAMWTAEIVQKLKMDHNEVVRKLKIDHNSVSIRDTARPKYITIQHLHTLILDTFSALCRIILQCGPPK